ncbi:hypothetical protein ABD91_20645 [Lysinibacillus sphaericus]|uniref:hypothetical protein n=1 Tax=Lysinibacillus sphaericus TaxID=1421 RepID=UPI0018CE2512|nr:hypothetical protein [Lysinibacillus sphaericus]MBG9693152.1 hypothetical protein [Lysinibacillus sphaericus]
MTNEAANVGKEKGGLKDLMKGLKLNLPTEEEMAKMAREHYENNRLNPNNFSFWFNPMSNALKAEFKVPKSLVMEYPFELREKIRQDRHAITPEIIKELEQFVFQNEEVKALNKQTQHFFIKTGVFSNKFDFDGSCNLQDWSNLFEQIYSLEYMAMTYSANHTNELVIREFITDVENRKTIYNGMPLRTEFRVFYDFDEGKVLGVANYWHPEEMIKALTPYSVRSIFAEITDIEEQRKLKKQLMAKLNNYDKQSFEEYFAYLDTKDFIVQEYDALKAIVASKVAKAFKEKKCPLKGQWSIDIMKNGNDFYFIDAAIMSQSALVNRMEAVEK